MRSTSTIKLAVGVLAAALALLGTVQPAAATAGTGAAPKHPLVTIGKYRAVFSPNADGFHDSLRIPYTIEKRAEVTTSLVGPKGKVIRTSCPGSRELHCDPRPQRAGTYTLRWEDVRPFRYNAHLSSGSYTIRFTATTEDGHRGRAEADFLYVRDGIPLDVDDNQKDLGNWGAVFSPNHDRVHDRLKVGFLLEARARVTATLTTPHDQEVGDHRLRIGTFGVGRHTWRWNGRVDGHVVPDATYELKISAKPLGGGPTLSGRYRSIVVDTTDPDASIVVNRDTVYPRSTVIPDSLRIGVDTVPELVRATIVKPDGRRLVSLEPTPHDCSWGDGYSCTLLSWYAKTPGGGPVPVGTYRLRITVEDPAGNAVTTTRPVTVSDAQLVQRTGTVTWAGDAAPAAQDYCAGNYCGEVASCGAHASDRFPGGVSFRSDPEDCRNYIGDGRSFRHYGYTPDLPAGGTTYDTFRISATGGPTTPGGPDTGLIGIVESASVDFYGDGPSAALTGDVAATTDWAPVRPDVELFPNDPNLNGNARMRWYAGAGGDDRYDIASYTLEYTYYVPAA